MCKVFDKTQFRRIFDFIIVVMLICIPSISPAEECGTPQVQVQTAWRAGTAIDKLDNIHIASINFFNDSANLYYSKLDKNGAVIVNDLLLSTVPNSITLEMPDIAVNNAGDAYVVWADNRDGNWEIYYSHIDNTGSVITGEKRVTNDPATSWKPSITIDSSGLLNVVWIDNRDGNTEIYYKKINNIGDDIISGVRVTDTNSLKDFLSSDIDSGDTIHLVWTDNRDGNSEVYYVTITNSGSRPGNDLQLTTTTAHNGYSHITIDSNNNAHVVWTGNMSGNWAVYYARLDTNGNRLAPDKIISDISSDSGNSYITQWNGGRLYIVFTGNSGGKPEIYQATLDVSGNSIEDTKKISDGPAASWSPSVVADNSGNPHFAWVDGYMLAYKQYEKSVTIISGYDPRKEKSKVINNLKIIKNRLGHKRKKQIEKAIIHIKRALKEHLWPDPCHLHKKRGVKVFKHIKHAFHKILKVVKRIKDEGIKEDLVEQIILLYEADRAIARRAIDDAKNNGGNPGKIKKGEIALAQAAELLSRHKYLKAINYLAKAWRYVTHS